MKNHLTFRHKRKPLFSLKHQRKNVIGGYQEPSWPSTQILPEVALMQRNEEHRYLIGKYDIPMDTSREQTIFSALPTTSLHREIQPHSTHS